MDREYRETSIEIFNKLRDSGKLSRRRLEIFKIVCHHGPITAAEAFTHAGLHGNANYRHNTNARLAEMRQMGVVKEVGTHKCRATGNNAILWAPTGDFPSAEPRSGMKPTRKQLEARIVELEAQVREAGCILCRRLENAQPKALDTDTQSVYTESRRPRRPKRQIAVTARN